jgi:nucleotide-binding universal stress UspA family protein
MNKKILVAIDNSDYATKVMNRALELASLYNSSLLGISVIDNSYFSDESSSYSTDTQSYWTASFQYIIDECAKLADETDVFYQHELLNGNPAEEIVRYAEQNGIDFIVIGHLGKSAASGFLIGSVAQKVASHSKCSVFIVK